MQITLLNKHLLIRDRRFIANPHKQQFLRSYIVRIITYDQR